MRSGGRSRFAASPDDIGEGADIEKDWSFWTDGIDGPPSDSRWRLLHGCPKWNTSTWLPELDSASDGDAIKRLPMLKSYCSLPGTGELGGDGPEILASIADMDDVPRCVTGDAAAALPSAMALLGRKGGIEGARGGDVTASALIVSAPPENEALLEVVVGSL